MTELQIAIRRIRQTIAEGEALLAKLEKQQKNLEASPHKWEHMDVFRTASDTEMILVKVCGEPDRVFCMGACTGHNDAEKWLGDGRFLFNLREKL